MFVYAMSFPNIFLTIQRLVSDISTLLEAQCFQQIYFNLLMRAVARSLLKLDTLF